MFGTYANLTRSECAAFCDKAGLDCTAYFWREVANFTSHCNLYTAMDLAMGGKPPAIVLRQSSDDSARIFCVKAGLIDCTAPTCTEAIENDVMSEAATVSVKLLKVSN